MNFFKRALASVTRRKGKSIILFAVVFILGNVIAGAISIQQATKSVEKNIKSQLGGTASVGYDQKEMDKFWSENPESTTGPKTKNITKKDIETIGNLSYVKYYDYSVQSGYMTSKFKNYQPKSDGDNSFSIGDPNSKYNNYFDVKGVHFEELLDVQEKKIEIVDGRAFTKDEIRDGKAVAVISKQVADANSLKVGDKLVLDAGQENYMTSQEPSDGEGDETTTPTEYFTQDIVYEVVGLFSPLKKEESKDKKKDPYGQDQWLEMQTYNRIYAPNDYVVKANKDFQKGLVEKFPDMKEQYGDYTEKEMDELFESVTPYFVLKSPEDAEAFRSEVTPLLPDKYSKLILSTDQYDSIAAPVKNMSKIATYVIYVSVGATLLIISLVVLLFMRDRKHELGIYLSLGETRSKVIGQIVVEVVVIAFVAITLSVFTGNFLAKGVSGSLIETQMKAKEEEDISGMNYDYQLEELTAGNSVDGSDVTDSYKVSLSLGYIIIFYVVGIGTVLLSTIVPLIYILRLNPKKIMM
ncbi:ABC transporter permease [Vagococcus sp. BWB3-3]|uniref:ABC transporter permease n=1 Tax=Vagococcus allomyrinae TaxID=2794353 RepID=A0A940PA52_9ENTE|nr:ABC transporter permease [Vagococcus allomyrinae]MBP1044122.1 ABC transporter permease [Vagococcus allomyrinae]